MTGRHAQQVALAAALVAVLALLAIHLLYRWRWLDW